MVALPHLIIVKVVRGRNLDATCTERRIHVGVSNDRYLAVGQRESDAGADKMAIARIIRVHRDSDVPQHGLRTRGRDDKLARSIGEWIADVPELALFLA